MSYYQKQKLSYSDDSTYYLGNAKNFWKDSIFAKDETEAAELKKLMTSGSLSHFQAKQLLDYALQNPTNEFLIYACTQLFKGLVEGETFAEIIWILDMTLSQQTDKILERLGHRFDNYPTRFVQHLYRLVNDGAPSKEVELAKEFISTCQMNFPFNTATDADRINPLDMKYRLQLIANELENSYRAESATLLKQDRVKNVHENIKAARDHTGMTYLEVLNGFKQYYEEQMQKNPYETIDMDGETAFQAYCQKHGEKNEQSSR